MPGTCRFKRFQVAEQKHKLFSKLKQSLNTQIDEKKSDRWRQESVTNLERVISMLDQWGVKRKSAVKINAICLLNHPSLSPICFRLNNEP